MLGKHGRMSVLSEFVVALVIAILLLGMTVVYAALWPGDPGEGIGQPVVEDLMEVEV